MKGAKNRRYEQLVVLGCATAVLYCWGRSLCVAEAQENPCDTSGKCGPFGVCNSQDSPAAVCSCLQGFDPVDDEEWSGSNWSGGCRRRLPLNCSTQPNDNNGTLSSDDVFVQLQKMEMSGYTDSYTGLQQNECQGRCLSNCSCLAYGFLLTFGCILLTAGTLMDLRKSPTGLGSDLYVRLSNSEPDFRLIRKKDSSMKIVIILVLVAFLIISSACTYISWKWRSAKKKKKIKLEKAGPVDELISQQVIVEELPMFKFEIVSNATANFSEANKLGKGGFGPVYKGELENGKEIAVKRLSSVSGQGMHEFMNEVVLISKLQHRNLVRLLGCCVDCKERMLIYEYMPNRSLDFFLFDTSEEILDWRKRFKIIEGICRGLIYLHRDSRLKIIHRDLKPSNILLDTDWNPKISDFGMARIFGTKQDHVSTIRVVGTYGYMAPEYALKGRFSEKSDVFSFGVVIIEIACGRRNASFYHQEGPLNLLGHVWNMWNEDKVAGVVDSRISSPSYLEEVKRCIHIGLLCVQQLPKDRPSVSTVLSMLVSSEVIALVPEKPAFSMKPSRSDNNNNIGISFSSQLSQKGSSSVNNVTLTTMVHGR
ncbi:hypothetical protein C2S51_018539 [Perilla frutescens var. frutescens]|nr:hypothetical protein C2S51_018539 [Perilla frutescens var. frutescens]